MLRESELCVAAVPDAEIENKTLTKDNSRKEFLPEAFVADMQKVFDDMTSASQTLS